MLVGLLATHIVSREQWVSILYVRDKALTFVPEMLSLKLF